MGYYQISMFLPQFPSTYFHQLIGAKQKLLLKLSSCHWSFSASITTKCQVNLKHFRMQIYLLSSGRLLILLSNMAITFWTTYILSLSFRASPPLHLLILKKDNKKIKIYCHAVLYSHGTFFNFLPSSVTSRAGVLRGTLCNTE